MTAEYPKALHVAGLRALWKEAFGDTDVFLDGFFDHGFSPHRCRCVTEGEKVLSALYWFGLSYRGQKLAYLYAVATAKDCRGQGLFARLLEDVKEVLRSQGYDGILLMPSGEGLARMYEKFGFAACGTVSYHEVAAAQNRIAYREIGPTEFRALQRKLLPEGSALPGAEMLTFLASQYRFFTGDGWLAVGQVYDGKLVCQEFLGDRSAMGGLVRALDVASGSFRTPGKTVPFVWFLPLHEGCESPGYFALALD